MNSSELKGFLTGLIIGDGRIDHGTSKRSFHIKSINEDFIKQIYDELTLTTNFKIRIKHYDSEVRNGVIHKEYWELTVLSHPYFAKKYHHFYDDYGKRIISRNAMKWLTAYGLANWYMSDGYVCLVGKESGNIYNRRIEICTDRYSKLTCNRLCKMLFERFQINSTIIKRSNRFRIRIMTDSYEHFIELIKPYVVDSMQYKLYLGYTHQPKWMSDDLWDYQVYLRSATVLPDNAEEHDIV